jgi:hypothetical protein
VVHQCAGGGWVRWCFTVLLTVAAVAALAWRGRPGWLPRWLLAEVIVICYGGDLVWQFVQAVQQLPEECRGLPARRLPPK